MEYYNKTRCYKAQYRKYRGKDMEIGYEEKNDQLAVILYDDYEYNHSVEITSGFIVDVDKKDRLVAIEILDCSKKINKNIDYVKNAEINVFVEVYEYSYKIIVDFNNGDAEIVEQVFK